MQHRAADHFDANVSYYLGAPCSDRCTVIEELNLARERTALLSATLWNYRASLAVDGNPETCSFTPRTSEQRWWQVDLSSDHHVGSVALIINKDSYQEFTVFVIQLLSKSEALYKPCDTFKGRFQNPRILFICNKGLGHRGRYVYIRDDRRDVDRFILCEVEVFAHRDENICGEPEEPVAGHVTVGLDATAIYTCDPGYRLLSEPNRTCERDGHWTGHAPQCEAITCGLPQQFPNMDVELANQSTLWNAVAVYSCKAGYSFAPGIIQTSISCLSSGVWEKTNMTCISDDDHHSPVQLTGKDWAPQPPHSDNESRTRSIVTPALISIGIICGLLIIILIVLGIVLAKRFQSKKSTRATPQSSTNDLIISNAKDGVYNDVGAPGFQMVVAVQPQCPPQAREEPPGNNTMPYFTRNQEPSCYDTLQSFPSVSSYNSTAVTDIEQDANYAHVKRGDADGEGTKVRDIAQDKPKSRQVLNIGYESVHIHAECEHPLSGTEYETVRSLQQMGTNSTFEIVQPNGSVRSLGKSKGKIRRSIPSALKLFLQPSSKTTEAELHEGVVPAEIMALYAQVDKTKKRKYRSGTLNAIDANHVSGKHICSQTEAECECAQHPISDIVRFSQDSCNPGVWNGNSKDCSASTLKESKATSPIARPLPALPTIRFIPAPQGVEPPSQTLECAQL